MIQQRDRNSEKNKPETIQKTLNKNLRGKH